MKIFTKNVTANKDGREETTYEISKLTLAGLAAALTSILAVANTATTLLKEWIIINPTDKVELKIKEDEFKLKLLQQALKSKDPANRARSIRFYIVTGMLKDESGEIMKLPEESLPSWEPLPPT
jgi:hypothetical protein